MERLAEFLSLDWVIAPWEVKLVPKMYAKASQFSGKWRLKDFIRSSSFILAMWGVL